jgi:hypothetical protein
MIPNVIYVNLAGLKLALNVAHIAIVEDVFDE